MSEVIVDLGGVYESSKRAAHEAVAGSPGSSFGLEDVMPEEAWLSVASSASASLIPLHGTLNGCIEALCGRKVSAAAIERVEGAPPAGMSVTAEDLRVARSWLADTLIAKVDEDGRQEMVDREAIDRGWVGNVERITSLVLALVLVAGAAVDQ